MLLRGEKKVFTLELQLYSTLILGAEVVHTLILGAKWVRTDII